MHGPLQLAPPSPSCQAVCSDRKGPRGQATPPIHVRQRWGPGDHWRGKTPARVCRLSAVGLSWVARQRATRVGWGRLQTREAKLAISWFWRPEVQDEGVGRDEPPLGLGGRSLLVPTPGLPRVLGLLAHPSGLCLPRHQVPSSLALSLSLVRRLSQDSGPSWMTQPDLTRRPFTQ